VLHGPTLRQAASNQQLTTETVTAQRGTISDRNGVDLAVSEPAQDISADPLLLKDPLGAAQRLAPLLGAPQPSVLRKLSERRGFVYLARALPAKAAQQVLALKIPGIAGTQVMRRVYPRGMLAAQVLGMVGTEGKGLAGLEYSRDSLLRGRSGKREVVSDAIGQPVSITEVHPEVPGPSLSLTLDANIQQRTEDVLGAVGRVFNPKDATAIVMDPNTGAVLAMANWPQVNANDPGASPAAAIENRAVGFAYEPGSTFKAVTVSGALQQGLASPSSTFNVPDQIHVADRTIHDDTEHAEETLTTSQILARSSNVGAIKIGMLEGAQRFNSWVHAFGFGAPSGIELPGEERGVTLALDHYSGSSMGNLPIGQGELVTPIQMATAYSAIADGGILRRPYLISSVGGRARGAEAGHRVISAATSAALRQMLEGVLAPGGTASEVSIPGYQLAGKTGTASKIDPATGEYSKTAYVASFIGFAPASNPKLLTAVVVDEPQTGSIYGGRVAAPAFGQIMSFALPYLRIPPG
jgi:cell division protein FtsI/penicillin-binding protein 2